MKNKIILFMVIALFYLSLSIGLLILPITTHAQELPVLFAQTLQLGSTGDQVKELQTFLKQFPSIYPEGLVTGYFGPLTEKAVKRFQKELEIDMMRIIGPMTRARLNEFSTNNTAGAAGTAGATGLTGDVGATGATGSTGITGTTGAAGAVGATGAAGTPGTTVPVGIELGSLDAFSRHQILNNMSSSILRLGSWQSDGDATSNISEGIAIYGNSLTGQTLAPGAGSIARIKNNRFGLFTIDPTTTGFVDAGGYYYRVDDSAMFYKNNAAVDVFRVARSTGNMAVKGTVTFSNFTQPGIIGTNSSGLLTNVAGTTGQVPVWDNSANGFNWAAAPAGTIPSAQYAQLGSQPGSIAAGQAFTYSTTVLSTPGVTATTTTPPGGTIFTLANAGRYEINYQMTYPTDGGVVLYLGATIPTMLPLLYTMIGKTPDGAVHGSVIIETTSANSFLSVNAAAGNAAAIVVPPNSSTTNQSATTISIKRIQ